MCLLGNKSDLESGRKVSTADASEYANSIDALFFETSALKNTGEHIWWEMLKHVHIVQNVHI